MSPRGSSALAGQCAFLYLMNLLRLGDRSESWANERIEKLQRANAREQQPTKDMATSKIRRLNLSRPQAFTRPVLITATGIHYASAYQRTRPAVIKARSQQGHPFSRPVVNKASHPRTLVVKSPNHKNRNHRNHYLRQPDFFDQEVVPQRFIGVDRHARDFRNSRDGVAQIFGAVVSV